MPPSKKPLVLPFNPKENPVQKTSTLAAGMDVMGTDLPPPESRTEPVPQTRRRKVNLPLIEVLGVSFVLHLLGLLILGGLTIYKMTQQPEPEFEAPPPPSESTPPPQIQVKLTKAKAAPPMKLSVQNISQLNMPMLNVDIPTINEKMTFGQGRGDGLAFGSGGGVTPSLKINLDSFGTTKELPYAWEGTVYTFDSIHALRSDGKWYKAVEDKHRQSKKLYNYSFNLSNRDFTEGFPGISKQFEWFAIDFETEIFWPAELAGDYEFRLESDDGSIFMIDDKDVIDNDGMHAMSAKEGRISIMEGKHKLRLAYFQGPATRIGLIFQYRRAGQGEWKVFDIQDFLPYQK